MMRRRDVQFCGWMFKEGKRFKTWRRRWFELWDFYLAYYKTEGSAKPINTIILNPDSILDFLHEEDAPYNNTFLLRTETRGWKFCVETQKERDMWMTEIRKNIPNTDSLNLVSTRIQELSLNLLEGFLEKMGKWHKAWKRRWCKLVPKQKWLLYYEVVDSKKTFKDSINLNNVSCIDTVWSKNHPYSFVLVTAGRRYKFAACNSQELEKWFQAIWVCIGGKRTKKFLNKEGQLHTTICCPRAKSKQWDSMNSDSDIILNSQTLMSEELKHELSLGADYGNGHVVQLINKSTSISFVDAMKLIEDTREMFMKKPLLLDIKGPIYIIGELNGDLDGLLGFFEHLGTPPEARYLFLGNIIGKRTQSLSVALLLFALKVHYPEHIYIIRGKMEDQFKSREPSGSLYDESIKRFGYNSGRELWKEFVWLFDHMPIGAVLNKKFFAVSSGLSHNLKKVSPLRKGRIRPLHIAITNNKFYPNNLLSGSVIVRDFVYNIPFLSVKSFKEKSNLSKQGLVYYHFGKAVINYFLRLNKFSAMIRSGQVGKSYLVYRYGNATNMKGKLISICSSANYNASVIKKKVVVGSVMFIEEGGENYTFHNFKPDL